MKKSDMDDWQRAEKIVKNANTVKRNVKHNAVKSIGRGMIKHCRLPLYKLNNNGSYKLDKNGNKIPKYKKKHGKKHLATRKPVSIKDLMSYYVITPKIANIDGIPISVVKAVQAIGLIKLHHSLQKKSYNLDKVIKDEEQAIRDLESKPKDQDKGTPDDNESNDDDNTNTDNTDNTPNNYDPNNLDSPTNPNFTNMQ